MLTKKEKPPHLPGKIRFYADENLDMALIDYIRSSHKVNVLTAKELGYLGREDKFHFQEAKKRGRFLLTCDKDFLNHSKYPFSQMLGIVILDIPSRDFALGWMSFRLTSEIVPSGKELNGTEVVVHPETAEIYSRDDSGKIVKETVEFPK